MNKIFDYKAINIANDRLEKTDYIPIIDTMIDLAIDDLHTIEIEFQKILIIGSFKTSVQQSFIKQFGNIYSIDLIDYNIDFLTSKQNNYDLILTVGDLHYIEELPLMLNSIKQSLKQNGILLASLIGGYSLKELKTVFKKIDYDYYKGLYPRFIPMIDIQDLGNLLQTIGFKNPIVKSETFIKHYIHIKDIVADLRKAKQGNYILDRKKTFTSKSVFQQAQNYYYEVYAKNNMLPASFDILTAIAYK